MQTSQVGDLVRAHYTKKFSDGSMRSSRARGEEPLEVFVGTAHPRLPGLGQGLVGVAAGQTVTVHIAPEQAYGMPDPNRVRSVDRARFPADEELVAGRRARMRLGRGRTRSVLILELRDETVVVDANHPRCGQSVELEVELVAILSTAAGAEHLGS